MDYKTLGKRIKSARKDAGLTQDDLAEAIEMSPMHISAIERGAKPPKLETFIRIANKLNVSADELLQDCIDCSLPSRINQVSQIFEQLPPDHQRCLLSSLEAYIKAFSEDENM